MGTETIITEKMITEKIITEKPPQDCEDTKTEKTHKYGVRHIQMACMAACMISLFTVRGSMGVLVLAMTDKRRANDTGIEIYDWDKKTQGVVLSSFFWGYMAMQIPAGLLSKRYGGKPILLVALIANGVLCLALPTLAKMGGWLAVCGARVAMGLTQACLFPASHTLLGRWLPDRERTALTGYVYGGGMVGTIISMPVAGILSETAMGWKCAFYALAGLMAVAAALWYALAASSPGQHRFMTLEEKEYIEQGLGSGSEGVSHLRTPWSALFRSVPLLAVMLAHFGMCGAFILFFTDMPTYMEKGLGLSIRNSASLSAMPFLGMWIGNNLACLVCEKVANRGICSMTTCRKIFNSLSFYGVTVGLTVLCFLGPESKNYAIATLFVTLTLKGCCSAGFMVNHLDLSPNFAGLLLSLTNFVANTNSVVTPIVIGVILKADPTDLSRWRMVFIAIATLTFVTNTAFLFIGTAERQPWDNPDYSLANTEDPEEMRPTLYEGKENGATQIEPEEEKDKL